MIMEKIVLFFHFRVLFSVYFLICVKYNIIALIPESVMVLFLSIAIIL